MNGASNIEHQKPPIKRLTATEVPSRRSVNVCNLSSHCMTIIFLLPLLQAGHRNIRKCLSYCLWLRLSGGRWRWKPQRWSFFSHKGKMSREQRVLRWNRYFVSLHCCIEFQLLKPFLMCCMLHHIISTSVVYLWLGRRYRYRDELRAMVKNDEVWQGLSIDAWISCTHCRTSSS